MSPKTIAAASGGVRTDDVKKPWCEGAQSRSERLFGESGPWGTCKALNARSVHLHAAQGASWQCLGRRSTGQSFSRVCEGRARGVSLPAVQVHQRVPQTHNSALQGNLGIRKVGPFPLRPFFEIADRVGAARVSRQGGVAQGADMMDAALPGNLIDNAGGEDFRAEDGGYAAGL